MTDKFVSPCSPPTAYQNEIATILAEECAEVIQRATKLQRFGVEEVQPGQPFDNAHRLGLEVGDLLEVIDKAIEAGVVCAEGVKVGRVNKQAQLKRFLQNKFSSN